MKKLFFLAAMALVLGSLGFAQNLEASVTISGAKDGGSAIYVALYDSEQGLKKNKPAATLILHADSGSASGTVSVPAGDYYVMAYQDVNGNGKLDTRLIGIPKEPVGISNYDGKGIPGGFDRHKARIDSATPSVTIILREIG